MLVVNKYQAMFSGRYSDDTYLDGSHLFRCSRWTSFLEVSIEAENHPSAPKLTYLAITTALEAISAFIDGWYARGWVPTFDLQLFPPERDDLHFLSGSVTQQVAVA